MKVDQNITLFVGGQPGNSLTTEGAGKKQENRKTVFAGDLNEVLCRIGSSRRRRKRRSRL